MSWGEWLTPERLITLVISVTLLEGLGLWIYRARTGKGVPGGEFIANWVSGLCLMLALLSAVRGSWWPPQYWNGRDIPSPMPPGDEPCNLWRKRPPP